MARASTRTRLPLDTWAAILGMDPRHFNQVTTDAKQATTCSTVWKQFAWQESDQVGREDVALAIQQAERMIEDYVGYHLLPEWAVDERVTVTKAAIPGVINTGLRTSRLYSMSFKGRRGHIISGGIEAKDLIEADAAVVYTDADGDGYPETATITVNTTVTDPEEIAVYSPGQSGHDDAELRPLMDPATRRRSVTISGGVATIVMQRELLVDPDLWNALSPQAVDGDNDANFLAVVDVYRHWNDPQQQVTLMWSPRGGDQCNCGDTTCPTCGHATQVGCLLAEDYRQGIWAFRPGTYDEDTELFTATEAAVGRNPDHLRAWYRSGLRDQDQDAPTLEMDPTWARAVAYLSLTFLTRPLCGCNNIQNLAKRMTEDLALQMSTGTAARSYRVTDRLLNNPWGTMRGAVYAWQVASDMGDRRIGQAVAL
jgi:hypothetical protein